MKKRLYYPRISLQGNKKVVVQKTIYKCNNRCIFCVIPDCFSEDEKASPPPDTSEFKRIIDYYSQDGRAPDVVAFTSAEPTLRPDIRQLLEYTIKKYPFSKINLLTNGRMFSHKKYADCFKPLFPHIGIDIPLHGPNGDVHDKLTSVNKSFDQTVQGIRNIYNTFPGIRLNVRILVHNLNYRHLEDTIAFVVRNFPGVHSIVLIYISMIGEAKSNHETLLLKFSDLKAPINDILRKYKNKAPILLFHFPYCVIDTEFWDMNAGKTLSEEQIEFPPICSSCAIQEDCCGFWKSEYNEKLFKEVVPIK